MVRKSISLCFLTLYQSFVKHLSWASKPQPGSACALQKIFSEVAEGCNKKLVYWVYLKVPVFYFLVLIADTMGSL